VVEQGNPRRVWTSGRKRIEGKTQYVPVSMSQIVCAAVMVGKLRTGVSPLVLMDQVVLGSAGLIWLRHQGAAIADNAHSIDRHANSTGEVLPKTVETLREARRFGAEVLAKLEEFAP
jgi:hypothetical protein